MKAEFEPFNESWLKSCARCRTAFSAFDLNSLSKFFPKERRKPDGYGYACKECKKIDRSKNKSKELARWKKYYSPGSEARKRHCVRSQTRVKYGSAKNKQCSRCGLNANEWHHYEYYTDSAIPLCETCHEEITMRK